MPPSPSPTRRRALTAAGAVAAASVVADPAAAAYRPARYRRTKVPGRDTRTLLSRFTYGYTPQLRTEVRRAGGRLAWFEQQLKPGRIPDRHANGIRDWFPSLDYSPAKLYRRNQTGVEKGWVVMTQLAQWTLLRRIYSHRQVHETMTEFWSNLLHVPASGGSHFPNRVRYDSMIRSHALGRFSDLLHSAITHEAMLAYLDGARSTKSAPNENLGRELLELHTVGIQGGYDQADVVDSARILTGWRVRLRDTFEGYYDTSSHWVGPVSVMGFSDANVSGDGRALTRRYLDYLAHHPATAERIARRLVTWFVSDTPDENLVARLAQVYLDHGTAIKPVLRALVRAPEFYASAGQKVTTPSQDVVKSYRALGVTVKENHKESSGIEAVLWSTTRCGQRALQWPRPDGEPLVGDAWTGVGRVMGSLRTHKNLAGGYFPTIGVHYRPPKAWIPETPIRFNQLVDHLSRRILGRRSTSALLEAACLATDLPPRERITPGHSLYSWRMPLLLAVFLDSPAHMMR